MNKFIKYSVFLKKTFKILIKMKRMPLFKRREDYFQIYSNKKKK